MPIPVKPYTRAPKAKGLQALGPNGQEAPEPNSRKKAVEASEPIEKQLWKTADKLRKNIDAAEYKHIVLGLVFLKYISDAFVELYDKLKAEESAGADPEDKDEYKAENVFFVPPGARWSFLQSHAKQPTIGKTVDEAMDAIERENDSLKGVLPKVYARQNLDPTSLGGLIDLIGNIALGDAKSRSADVLGHVFEYFLGEFALAEGKKGGQFYTPRSVVELLVKMLEPYKGRVFDPCCGSGGMFVQSEKFVTEHQGKVNDISIYGQESNQTTWRLAKMNLAIRGLDSSQVKWNSEGSFLNDAHKDLKADYIIANPPFNVSDWSGDLLRTDGRWQYGVPPEGNANFGWMQHFIYHLSPSGQAGVVLSKGALTSKSSGEGEIRKAMVEAGLIDCIVNLPAKLFLNTGIPACLWFLSRNRANGKFRSRTSEILFIDARHMGHLVNRRTREFSEADINTIADTYHNWRNPKGTYADVPGFCCAAPLSRVKELDYVLTPGRYVGLADEEDDFVFAERFATLQAEFAAQLKEESELNSAILKNLKSVKVDG
ncbi:MAG: SAM-dependent DNA methyltransferase [Flavobacteriales bacterium]|nr:SAM-dependent DNA methyltransferase [Flavobacteriales bacterium]